MQVGDIVKSYDFHGRTDCYMLERLETHRKAMLGHRVSDETKAKMSAAKRGKSPKQNSYIAVCPHCGKEG